MIDSRITLANLYQPHPARTEDFDTIYDQLTKYVQEGSIRVSKQDDLELFTYTRECTTNYLWTRYHMAARGLILCPSQKKVVATPLCKFWNYGEVSCQMPELPFEAYEKIDGSLGILYYWNNKWNMATRGSFNSSQAQWATKFFERNIDSSCLIPGNTYVLEIVFPENKIVVNYKGQEALYLLTVYDQDGYELGRTDLDYIAYSAGFEQPKIYEGKSIQDLLVYCTTCPKDEEGFVIRYSNGFRMKIKSDAYVRLHQLISDVTPLGIWRAMRECDSLELIRKEVPEEVLKDINQIVSILENQFEEIWTKIEIMYRRTQNMTDKETALFFDAHYGEFASWMKGFVFTARKEGLYTASKPSRFRNAIFDLIKPKANVLRGYTPTNVMNRFGATVNEEV